MTTISVLPRRSSLTSTMQFVRSGWERLASVLVPPQIIFRWLLSADGAFVFGLLVSAVIYSRGRHIRFQSLIVSYLASPISNPHGFAAGAVGMALYCLLHMRAAAFFYRRLYEFSASLALLGYVTFVCGLASLLLICCWSLFVPGEQPHHVACAYAAWLGFIAGKLIWMIVAGNAARIAGDRAAIPAAVVIAGDISILVFLMDLYFNLFFNRWFLAEDPLWRSRAFLEWSLFGYCTATLWILAVIVVSPKFRRDADYA